MLDTLFLLVLNMSITASFVILMVLLVRLFLKKAPKIFSYALWAVVLFRLISPFSFESVLGLVPINKQPIQENIVYSTESQINTGLNIVDNTINTILPIPNNTSESINPLQRWVFVGSVIWVIGITAMLIYSIIQFLMLKRNLIGSTPLRDNIYLTDYITSPFVIGFIKPKIYLSSSLADTEQEFIIIHEQCHIMRLDHITRILAFMALTLHWFNPLVWLAFILSGKDMEMSCDEAVMKKMDTDIRAEYSQSLLRFASGRKIISAALLTFGESDTKGRIKNVMKYKKPMRLVSIAAITTVICVAVGLMSSPKSEPVPINAERSSVEKLWENRTKYVGNHSAVGNILFELSFPHNIQYKSFELKTKEKPYEIIIHFESLDDALKVQDYVHSNAETVWKENLAQLENNAKVVFSLIENVDKITFSIHLKDGETLTKNYMRNKYNEFFPKTATYEGFQTVLEDIYTTHNLSQDQAVALAITSNGNRYMEGECIAEGHIILGYDDKAGNNTKIYALTMLGWYGFENNNFVKVSGSGVIPAVITLDNNNRVEIEYASDGSDYRNSIETLFPQKYHRRILKQADSDYDNLKQQEQQYAKEYLLKISRDAKVGDTTDFEYTTLSDIPVSVEVSNKMNEEFYKEHSSYPSFIGTQEKLENGIRTVYKMSYHKAQNEIKFTKYAYDKVLEQFIINAKTGHISSENIYK